MLYTKHPSSVSDFPASGNYDKFPANAPNPSNILGALYHSEFRAWDAANTIVAGPKVSVAKNFGLDASDASQGTDANRPLYDATGFNGGPCFKGNGSAVLSLTATLNNAILSTARPYGWWVMSNGTTGARRTYGGPRANAGTSWMLAGSGVGAGNNWYCDRWNNSTEPQTDSGVNATAIALVEVGFTAGGTAAIVVNGTATDSTNIALGANLDRMDLVASIADALSSNIKQAYWLLASDEPSAAQKTAIRAYIRGNNFPAYTGSNFGLP